MKQIGGRRVWAVAEVTGAIARRLEKPPIPQVWVEGEITNLNPGSGARVWFTLSGDDHELGCSMARVVWDQLPTAPANGDRVVALGKVEYWAQRNRITFWAEKLEPGGEGLLLAEIERLRRVLRSEGLIPGRARPLPVVPWRIGLVTSAGAAAFTDAMRVIGERWPEADVVHHDAQVQGEAAPAAIVAALAAADAEPGVEVILLVRGGGSLEDLMAFNDERVCRAITACQTPVVTGVGHERDGVLADEVADLRCATPTAAAAAVTPDAAELRARFDNAERRMRVGLRRSGRSARESLTRSRAELRRSLGERERLGRSVLDSLTLRLRNGVARPVLAASPLLDERGRRLSAGLSRRAERAGAERASAASRLATAMEATRTASTGRLDRAEGLLVALSPTATLSRGYAIVRDGTGAVRPESAEVAAGDPLEIEFRDGRVAARAEERE